MVIRTKSGEYRAESGASLLDFLGVRQEAVGWEYSGTGKTRLLNGRIGTIFRR
jgi:hypothetical protein